MIAICLISTQVATENDYLTKQDVAPAIAAATVAEPVRSLTVTLEADQSNGRRLKVVLNPTEAGGKLTKIGEVSFRLHGSPAKHVSVWRETVRGKRVEKPVPPHALVMFRLAAERLVPNGCCKGFAVSLIPGQNSVMVSKLPFTFGGHSFVNFNEALEIVSIDGGR